jgi:hypothetical protein
VGLACSHAQQCWPIRSFAVALLHVPVLPAPIPGAEPSQSESALVPLSLSHCRAVPLDSRRVASLRGPNQVPPAAVQLIATAARLRQRSAFSAAAPRQHRQAFALVHLLSALVRSCAALCRSSSATVSAVAPLARRFVPVSSIEWPIIPPPLPHQTRKEKKRKTTTTKITRAFCLYGGSHCNSLSLSLCVCVCLSLCLSVCRLASLAHHRNWEHCATAETLWNCVKVTCIRPSVRPSVRVSLSGKRPCETPNDLGEI